MMYERITLNKKQYASAGSYFSVKVKYIQGEEFSIPGSTSVNKDKFRKIHEWPQVRIAYDSYLKSRGIWRLGVYAESVFSAQTLFNNYTASILSSPVFQPTPESKTLFLPEYRAHKFVGGGIKNIFVMKKNFELRLEGYVFLPYQAILDNPDHKATYGGTFDTKHYIGNAALIYHSPIGPVSASVNYYDIRNEPFSFLFHFGYIIFNKKALE